MPSASKIAHCKTSIMLIYSSSWRAQRAESIGSICVTMGRLVSELEQFEYLILPSLERCNFAIYRAIDMIPTALDSPHFSAYIHIFSAQ